MAEQRSCKPQAVGSTPTVGSMTTISCTICGLVAQRLARGAHNPEVTGSNPVGPTDGTCERTGAVAHATAPIQIQETNNGTQTANTLRRYYHSLYRPYCVLSSRLKRSDSSLRLCDAHSKLLRLTFEVKTKRHELDILPRETASGSQDKTRAKPPKDGTWHEGHDLSRRKRNLVA